MYTFFLQSLVTNFTLAMYSLWFSLYGMHPNLRWNLIIHLAKKNELYEIEKYYWKLLYNINPMVYNRSTLSWKIEASNSTSFCTWASWSGSLLLMHPHHSGQSGRQPTQPKHSLPQEFSKVRGNRPRLKASHSCSLVLVTTYEHVADQCSSGGTASYSGCSLGLATKMRHSSRSDAILTSKFQRSSRSNHQS
jgi:hypothetical protein